MHGLRLMIKEDASPCESNRLSPMLKELARRGMLAPETWNCKRAQINLKASIDVPMLGTVIEQNGDGLLEESYMLTGWPLHIDGAVRQRCIHQDSTLYELDTLLGEYDVKRDLVEVTDRALSGHIEQFGINGIFFFSSGLAVNALWHGPDNDISSEKAVSSSLGWYQQMANHNKQQNTSPKQDDPQIPQQDLRFVSKAPSNKTKGAGPNKNTHTKRICHI